MTNLWLIFFAQAVLAGSALLIGGPYFRCPRFSLACTGTLAPVLVAWFLRRMGCGISEAIVLAISISGSSGLILWELLESRVSATRQADMYRPIALSIGVWVVFETLVTAIWGSSARLMEPPNSTNSLTNGSCVGGGIGFIILALMQIPTARRFWRAAWNPELAEVLGITRPGSTAAFVLASHLVMASCGIMAATGVGFTPRHGLALFFTGMTVYALGGRKSWSGCLLSAVFVASVRLAVEALLGMEWVGAATFAILICFCLWSPSGFNDWWTTRVRV
jgi:branched-subunit amino acid ABC-type transport system permease component